MIYMSISLSGGDIAVKGKFVRTDLSSSDVVPGFAYVGERPIFALRVVHLLFSYPHGHTPVQRFSVNRGFCEMTIHLTRREKM